MHRNQSVSQSVSSETSLRDNIRTGVRSGRLPHVAPVRVLAGTGRGLYCAACGRPIEAAEIEYEVEWADQDLTPLVRLHVSCYEVWKSELTLDEALPDGVCVALTS